MTEEEVLRVVAALRAVQLAFWLDGGWGVDALLGEQHRNHNDLDVVMALVELDKATAALAVLGYRVSEDYLPTRLVLRADADRQIDVHPITFDQSGTGWQARAGPDGQDCPYPSQGFTTGVVGSMTVGCLSGEVQLAHHLGYTPGPHDHDDMQRLAARFDLDLPDPYRAQVGEM